MSSVGWNRRPRWILVTSISAICLGASLLRLWPSDPSTAAATAWSACCDPSAALPVSFRAVVAPVWLGAAAVVLGRGLLRAARRLRNTQSLVATLEPSSAPLPPEFSRMLMEEGLAQWVDVVDEASPFAFCHGLIRPRICMSRGLLETLSPDQARAVLFHEHHHLVNRHPLQALMMGILVDALFFLPVIADLRDSHEALSELRADRRAIERTGREPLAGALLRLIAHPGQRPIPQGLAVSRLDVTRARVDQILGDRPLRTFVSFHRVALTLASLAAGCLMWMSALA